MIIKNRTWLKDKYPLGVGLGVLLREYFELKAGPYLKDNTEEQTLRISEISALLDCMCNLTRSPSFSYDASGDMIIKI